jgi:hypothetical protein
VVAAAETARMEKTMEAAEAPRVYAAGVGRVVGVVGEAEGSAVGDRVVGDRVVGELVGNVGAFDGVRVGDRDGDRDGERDGDRDGVRDGDPVLAAGSPTYTNDADADIAPPPPITAEPTGLDRIAHENDDDEPFINTKSVAWHDENPSVDVVEQLTVSPPKLIVDVRVTPLPTDPENSFPKYTW